MMTELSQLNSFLSLAVFELNKSQALGYSSDTRRWYINHYVHNNEMRSEITFGEQGNPKLVVSLRTGTLVGNTVRVSHEDLKNVFADGLIMMAEKKSLNPII